MRPSRLVVGEVRAEECLDLLLALNSGLPGMATVHANSARETLVQLCTLPLLAGAKQGRTERNSRPPGLISSLGFESAQTASHEIRVRHRFPNKRWPRLCVDRVNPHQ
jgi:hypothetical protein